MPAARRDQILEATLRVVARDGLDGIHSAVVAREVGVSPALPHHYFPTLHDLVVAAYAYDSAASPVVAADLHAMHDGSLTGPEGRLRERLMVWHEYARRAAFDPVIGEAVSVRIGGWQASTQAAIHALEVLPADGDAVALAAMRVIALYAGLTEFILLEMVSVDEARSIVAAAIDGIGGWSAPPPLRPPLDLPSAPTPPADRRSEILDAAVRTVARGGVRALHFADVAAEAGVSTALPRYYFPTLGALRTATFDHRSALAFACASHRATRISDPVERVRDACLYELALGPASMRENWLLWCEQLRIGFIEPQARAHAVHWLETWLADDVAAFEEARAAGAADPAIDPRAAALHLMAVHNGLGSGFLIGQVDLDDLQRVIDWTIADLLTGRP